MNENLSEILGFRNGLPEIKIRVGICTGEVIAGNIGSSNSKNYTVMGDTVNIAARLESANKQFGTRILLSDLTNQMVKDEFETRRIDNIVVVGKVEPIFLFELLGEQGKVELQTLELRDFYEKAYNCYREKDWEPARDLLNKCLEIKFDDKPSQLLKERIEHFMENPPPANWDGIWRLTKK